MACPMVSAGPLYFVRRATTLLFIHLWFSFCEKPARKLLELAGGTAAAQQGQPGEEEKHHLSQLAP